MSNNPCDTTCTGEVGPFTPDGNPSNPGAGGSGNGQCVSRPGAVAPCPKPNVPTPDCAPWQLTDGRDSCIIDQYTNELLNIAGATFNVYKLLGVHEQGVLIDSIGQGTPISNGDLPNHPARFAFDVYATEWKSIQKGTAVTASAYIGYDFGEIKTLDGSRRMYGIEANARKLIATIAIKQSSNTNMRATKARMERSDDGIKWYGVGIVQLPDDDCLNIVNLRSSVPSRFWRLRPTEFNGGPTDSWGVQAFQMVDSYTKTHIDNIQDKILFENRDRDYASEPLIIKGSYELMDVNTELSKFGIELPTQVLNVQVNFSAVVAILGRPLVIGDIVEVPSEAQYSAEMRKILKWMEVTDVSWSSQGYTPGWQPTLLNVTLQPAMVSQETQDLFGDLAENQVTNGLGLVDRNNGEDKHFQDFFDMSQTAQAIAKDDVPEAGAEGSGTIRQWEQSELDAAKQQGLPHLQRIGLNPTGLYVEDAMPPNNAPFTEGDIFPSSPKHGDYHRLTYSGLSKDVSPRLHRYSTEKGRWVYLETDRRKQFNNEKTLLKEFMTSPNKKSNTRITK